MLSDMMFIILKWPLYNDWQERFHVIDCQEKVFFPLNNIYVFYFGGPAICVTDHFSLFCQKFRSKFFIHP